MQREEQQRRQRRAPTSHPGAAGSAPAVRPAPRRGNGGAGRALGALGAVRTSQSHRPAAVRPAGLGQWGAQTRRVQLPPPLDSGGRAESLRVPGSPDSPRGATATSRCPRTRRPLAQPGEPLPPNSSPDTLAAAGLPLGSAPPTRPARSPRQPRLQRDAWRPTSGASAARSWRGRATCALGAGSRTPPLSSVTWRRASSSLAARAPPLL